MRKHTKLYMECMGYDDTEWMPCEMCNSTAVDVHHISSRGMGGDPLGKKDTCSNLMALCRKCHNKFGDKKKYVNLLVSKHKDFVELKRTKAGKNIIDKITI